MNKQNHGKWQSVDADTYASSAADRSAYNNLRQTSGRAETVLGAQNGMSNSDVYLQNRYASVSSPTAGLKKGTMSKVSAERQNYLNSVMDSGTIRANQRPTPIMVKNANMFRGHDSGGDANSSYPAKPTGRPDSYNIAPDYYDPLYLTANLQLPRDIYRANSWNRAYYETNPYVRNAINLHATYPISKMSIKCDDKKVEEFFNDMIEETNFENFILEVALEYHKLGESVDSSSFITLGDGSQKKISDIRIGDIVLTHLGNKKKVTETFIKPVKEIEKLKIYKMVVDGINQPLIISGNHPVLSKPRGFYVCPTKCCAMKGMRVLPGRTYCSNCKKTAVHNTEHPDFAFASELNLKDIVFAPFNQAVANNEIFTADFCYLIGQWMAEGCYTKNTKSGKKTGIKFCSYDRSYVYDVLEPLLEKIFGFAPKTYISKSTGFGKKGYSDSQTKDKFDTHFSAKFRGGFKIAEFFTEHCGEYSHDKKFSNAIMELPPELQAHILAGFADGDGCIDIENGHAILCTTSRDMASQLLMMLRRIGLRPTFCISKARPETNSSESFRLQLNCNETFELLKNRLRSSKNDKVREVRYCAAHSGTLNCWQVTAIREIEDITSSYTEKFMYDLEVEDDHSYVANGIAVHNCFPYSNWDESKNKWNKFYCHNPDFVNVRGSPIPGHVSLSLRVDPELKKMITSTDPSHIRVRDALDPKIIQHVMMNEPIPLDSFNVSHLKNLSSPYDLRGTSMIVSVWKDLMLYDKIRESKFAQADDMINPMTVVKVGASNPDGLYPTEDELEHYRQILESAAYDKNFKLVTHDAVTIERVGYNSGVLDVNADIQIILDNILTGLMVPKSILNQDGASYSSASVGLDVMRQRYSNFRTMMANWIEKKIFAPVSEANNFYKKVEGVNKLIVPKVEWNHITLYDTDNYLTHILPLIDKQHVSMETVYRSLGLSRENEMTNIRKEAIENAIIKKEMEELGKMPLTQLRGLDPNKAVPEVVAAPGSGLPGTPGAGGLPGGGLDSLLGPAGGAGPPPPGGDAGGMGPPPDMGSPPGPGATPPPDLGGGPPPG